MLESYAYNGNFKFNFFFFLLSPTIYLSHFIWEDWLGAGQE